MTAPDAVTVEIIRAKLNAAAERMRITMIKTSFNAVINESLDFGCGIFDADVRMLAQGIGVPLFQGHIGFPISATLRIRETQSVRPGDIYMHNDPYDGNGNHLNDVTIFAPVFADDGLAGWVAVKAHWLDIGGSVPSSILIDSTDFRQEGLRFQALKLYDAGNKNEELLRIIDSNIRPSTGTMKDAEAMIAVCHAGVAYFAEVLAAYGSATVRAACSIYMSQSAQRMRAAISDFPDGRYDACGHFDNDGIDIRRPVRVQVAITVEGSTISIDCTGTSPAVAGPFNCGSAMTISMCRLLLMALMMPEEWADEGCYQPLTIIVPDGTVLSATEPAPVARYYVPVNLLLELSLKALSRAAPDRIPAAMFADQMPTFIFGTDASSEQVFVFGEVQTGGSGARTGADGESALMVFAGNTGRNIPIEVHESRNRHLRILSYSLRSDSGGRGEFRGGLGTERQLRFDIATHGTFTLERSVVPPWGLVGGEAGSPNEAIIDPGAGDGVSIRKATRHPIAAGSVVILRSGGGGGFGNPCDRPATAIADDLRQGYISPAAAAAWRAPRAARDAYDDG